MRKVWRNHGIKLGRRYLYGIIPASDGRIGEIKQKKDREVIGPETLSFTFYGKKMRFKGIYGQDGAICDKVQSDKKWKGLFLCIKQYES